MQFFWPCRFWNDPFFLWERYRSISPPKLFELNFFTMVWHLSQLGFLNFIPIHFYPGNIHQTFNMISFRNLRNISENKFIGMIITLQKGFQPIVLLYTVRIMRYISYVVVTCHIGCAFPAQWEILFKKGVIKRLDRI